MSSSSSSSSSASTSIGGTYSTYLPTAVSKDIDFNSGLFVIITVWGMLERQTYQKGIVLLLTPYYILCPAINYSTTLI